MSLNPLGTIQTFPTLHINQYQYNHEYITDKPIYGKAQYQNGIELLIHHRQTDILKNGFRHF